MIAGTGKSGEDVIPREIYNVFDSDIFNNRTGRADKKYTFSLAILSVFWLGYTPFHIEPRG